ncbi:unnamed protein product, partial [marine sediment metagenome]
LIQITPLFFNLSFFFKLNRIKPYGYNKTLWNDFEVF